MSLFKTNKTKNYIKITRVKNVYGGVKKPRKANKTKQQQQQKNKM